MKILIFWDSIWYGKRWTSWGWISFLRKNIDHKYNLWDACSNTQVYNLCIPWETALRMQTRFEQELKMRIDSSEKNLVLLAIGVNDSHKNPWIQWSQTPQKEFQESIKNMIETANMQNCNVWIIWLLPAHEERVDFINDDIILYDSYLKDLSDELWCPYSHNFSIMPYEYITTLWDWIHPDDLWHRMIYDAVKPFIFDLIKDS